MSKLEFGEVEMLDMDILDDAALEDIEFIEKYKEHLIEEHLIYLDDV